MSRQITLFVFFAMLLSALYLVRVQYDYRLLNAQLHRAQTEGQALKTEQGHLLVAKRSLETPQRIEVQARKRLGMSASTPASTYYLHQLQGTAAAAKQGSRQ